MPTIGWFEILIVVSIAIIVLGPKDFPIMLKKVGSWIGTAKKYINNIQKEVSNIDIEDNKIDKQEDKKLSSFGRGSTRFGKAKTFKNNFYEAPAHTNIPSIRLKTK